MKKYLLLRDNRQSGPWSLAELEMMTLRSQDLVWDEQGSQSWKYPAEITELVHLIREESYEERESKRLSRCTSAPPADAGSGFLEPVSLSPDLFPERLRKPSARRLPVWKRHLMKPSSGALNMLAVFAGLIFCALMMRKVVDGFSEGPSHDLPVAYIHSESYEARNEGVQHALRRELVPSDEDLARMPPPVSAKPKDIKQQIRMRITPEKKTDSSGAGAVQLRLYNGSPHFVEKLTVRVSYYQGDSLTGTKMLTASNLKSHGETTIRLPLPSTGIRVRPYVSGVYSHEYREALKEL